ncbi:repressible alkaline phosphatase precursor [Cordyceps militaris]|uniref:Alkaline phosphatase n=1 Tax=Cordyceps militaris TaxID=73501 RepID=A0A2H4S5Y0_CORMI|nr:repressible alkaline phosphatase precursor [Cordyceps militaris]
MSGAELLGIISAVISIVDATIKVYNAAKDDAGLPPNFKTVSTKFPLVSMLLKDAERYINDKADSTITATFTPVLTHCKEKATELQQVFEKVIPTEGDARIERYFKAARAIGKGGRVETLMEGILHDLQLLTAKLPVAISARGQASLTEAIEEVKELDPSLPDGFEDAPSFAHSGTGAQNVNTGLADRAENVVAHFFSNAGACATRSQCNEFASNTFGGPTKPVPMQGLFSYSVITANDSVIVQFRDPASPLDVGMVNAAHRIHSEVVAGCSYLGTLGTSPGLPIYSMKMLPGDNYLSISLSESSEDLAFQLATIRSLARFFAQSWQYNADSYASEHTPLLDEHQSANDGRRSAAAAQRRTVREVAIFGWALVATAAFIVLAVWVQHAQQTHPPPSTPPPKRNLVFMVSDGMGPASLALARGYHQHVARLAHDDVLTLDRHLWGTSRTRSSDSLVTDSAAGATAFSCARKTYNGAIAVLPDGRPCGSVLEAAKRAGYATGLVATTYLTDATPACFAAHVPHREMMDAIALQEVGEGPLGRSVDLLLGGGRCYFLPNSSADGCRQDDVDVTSIARDKHGWTYVDSRAAFDALDGGHAATLPLLGLVARGNVPFELDRRALNDTYPSLAEMTTTALRALARATADSDRGFFVLIEGSRIDHAGHINDPAAQVHEVLAYDAAFRAVLDFIAASPTETVLVATSDHETGGLATALQRPDEPEATYDWYPAVLARAAASCERLAAALRAHSSHRRSRDSAAAFRQYVRDEVVSAGLGIPAADITEAEVDSLVAAAEDTERARTLLAHIISRRAHIGWSTHGHTAVDVNIYSSGGPGTDALRGNVENTEVGDFLRRYLDVDVDAITRELQAKSRRSDEIAGVMGTPRGAFDEYHAHLRN